MNYTAEDLSYLMNTNFESAYHLCQLAQPLLKASGAGNIVFMSSVSGVISVNVGTIYGATKGSLLRKITLFLLHQLASFDLRIEV